MDGQQEITQEVFADASHTVHDDTKGHGGAIARTGNASVYASSTKESSTKLFTKPLHGELFRVMRTKVLECYVIYCIKIVGL